MITPIYPYRWRP